MEEFAFNATRQFANCGNSKVNLGYINPIVVGTKPRNDGEVKRKVGHIRPSITETAFQKNGFTYKVW